MKNVILLQQASGIFGHMKDLTLSVSQQDPTPDLTPDTLNALSSLMLAQAQEAIYRKATTGMLEKTCLSEIYCSF